MIFEAKLPAKPGYIERVNPTTGEHFYHKVGLLKGYSHETIIINRSQSYELPRDVKFATIKVTCIGAGGSIDSTGLNGGDGEVVTKSIRINTPKSRTVDITIGSAGVDGRSGEPTAFGDYLCANGGVSGIEYGNSGYDVDGVVYGMGETTDHKATAGLCIIEYDMPIYGA